MNNVAKKCLLREQDKQHHLHPFTNPLQHALEGPNMVESADGIYLHTDDGRKIMDVGSGLANVRTHSSLMVDTISYPSSHI